MSSQITHDGEVSLQSILQQHLAEVTRLRDTLKEPAVNAVLMEELHNTASTSLPNKDASSLAAQTIDVLHETIQLLQPGHLILADHFLGMPLPLHTLLHSQTKEMLMRFLDRLHQCKMPARGGPARCP
jgi:hypothetical protein